MKIDWQEISDSISNIGFIIIAVVFIRSCTEVYAEAPILRVEITHTDTIKHIEPYDTIHLDRATRYNAVSSQTNSNPHITADGSRIDVEQLNKGKIRWVALSRDLICDSFRDEKYPNKGCWKGSFRFGDTILVHSESKPFLNGKWIVHDCMNARYRKSIDFLTPINNQGPKLGIGKDVKILIKNG